MYSEQYNKKFVLSNAKFKLVSLDISTKSCRGLCLNYLKKISQTWCSQCTDVKISYLVASLPTGRQQVVFALLDPSCQQVWNKLLKVVTILLILSDLLQGCSNKSDTVMI
jgi:hypothetical protein